MKRSKLLFFTFITEGFALFLALAMVRYLKIPLFPLTGNILRDVLIGTFGAAVPFSFFIFLLSEKTKRIPFADSLKQTITHYLKSLFSRLTLPDMCIISLLAGFAEELLFRGVTQNKLGIFATSVIFGLLHFISPAYFVIAFLMSIYLGLLYYYFQSLLVPIQAHFIYDLCALIYLKHLKTIK
ncbi:MAG: CPBP family intramembrane metalloprotease [Candidatus Kuenenia sp.]|nr:CPBP family intramembrane metalloprotease [Candidatus Kuenenia hertensis]